MDNIVREVLKTKITGLKATAFQDALDRIYHCIYGEIGFQRVKQKHDGGSDGIVNGETVLAAYAPERYNLNDFKKKVGADFDSYAKNWEFTHGKWEVITNLEATAQMLKFVDGLKKGAPIVCIEGLLQKIDSQTWTVKMAIFRALNIPELYLSNDAISTVIEDLIHISNQGAPFEPYERPAYIQEKIELNVSVENIDSFLEEYEEHLAVFPIISSIVGARPQGSVSSIRSKVRSTFLSLSGSFEKRLSELVNILSQGKSQDDYYSHNMRVVMVYFFEQCLFGKKPKSEVNR
jgi:hypothetical protein